MALKRLKLVMKFLKLSGDNAFSLLEDMLYLVLHPSVARTLTAPPASPKRTNYWSGFNLQAHESMTY